MTLSRTFLIEMWWSNLRTIENLMRRLLFSFFAAVIVTKSFVSEEVASNWYIQIPVITWLVFAVVFICSWRVEKEFAQLFIRAEVEEGETPIDDFEKKNPYISNLLWQFFVTFAAIHVFAIALDWLLLVEVNGHRLYLFFIAVAVAVLFRIFDASSYRKSFNIPK